KNPLPVWGIAAGPRPHQRIAASSDRPPVPPAVHREKSTIESVQTCETLPKMSCFHPPSNWVEGHGPPRSPDQLFLRFPHAAFDKPSRPFRPTWPLPAVCRTPDRAEWRKCSWPEKGRSTGPGCPEI